MSCSAYRENLRPWLRGELTDGEASAVQEHVAGCYACARVVENESAIAGALREVASIPEPSEGFERRVLAAATGQSPAAKTRSSLSMPVAGGAIAAALALGVALGIGLQPGNPGRSVDSAVVDAGQVQRTPASNLQTVRFAFNSAKALDNVTLTVELPPHVEMADYPGYQKLSWNLSLDRGENIVQLPLNVLFPGDGELVARLDDGEREKTFRTRLSQKEQGQNDQGGLSEPVL
jgi:hypothetical protein